MLAARGVNWYDLVLRSGITPAVQGGQADRWPHDEDATVARRKTPGRSIVATGGGPGGLYRFVEIGTFTEDWSDLGLDDDDLWELEDRIAREPTRAPVVPGGGGVRKIRVGDSASGKGKSGGSRVLYAFLADFGTVLLIAAWPKSEREDLEPGDYRAISRAIARIRELLKRGAIR